MLYFFLTEIQSLNFKNKGSIGCYDVLRLLIYFFLDLKFYLKQYKNSRKN